MISIQDLLVLYAARGAYESTKSDIASKAVSLSGSTSDFTFAMAIKVVDRAVDLAWLAEDGFMLSITMKGNKVFKEGLSQTSAIVNNLYVSIY